MNTPTRLGLYGLALVVAFAGALGVGRLVGPLGEASTQPGGGHADAPDHAGASTPGHAPNPGPAGAPQPGGLQVSVDGYRLVTQTPALAVGASTPFRFQIVGPDGAPVTRFTEAHDKELHLIVVRRDLSGFQHVHPSRAEDGTWSIPLTVPDAGQYRVFADFQPAGRDRGLTLGVDVPAAGLYTPRPLPAPDRTATVDGYRVDLVGDLVPGTASEVTLRVSRDGTPVTDLTPYLGAYGHLVALRDGDLAYLHVHPEGEPGDGRTPAGPDITFFADVPSSGAYRLFLDFQHGGVVRTAEFTVMAGGAVPPTGPVDPAPSASSGHNDQPHGHG